MHTLWLVPIIMRITYFNNIARILKRETFLPSTDTQSCGKQANFKKKEKMRLAMSLYTSPMFLHRVELSENKT